MCSNQEDSYWYMYTHVHVLEQWLPGTSRIGINICEFFVCSVISQNSQKYHDCRNNVSYSMSRLYDMVKMDMI